MPNEKNVAVAAAQMGPDSRGCKQKKRPDRFRDRPRWTVENRQFVDRPKPAISSAETSEFYFVPSSVRKSVCTFVRQLRGP
ncbi:MAG TPA: hypothetical protein VM818_17445, partial [Vicinamibacterales bacterium]|nr:hypothetical protein [Vicinamibacterales bacterium]